MKRGRDGKVGTEQGGGAPTEAEHLRRRGVRSRQQAKQTQSEERSATAVLHGWKCGVVAPWRTTRASRAGGYEGPDVNIAEGPAGDEWVAGQRYPTFDQLVLLVEITGFPLTCSRAPTKRSIIRTTTLRMQHDETRTGIVKRPHRDLLR